jgi:glyoxylase-like metal-dependent hydrolase (beta-lactamase superfamily II)/rhodanese-related sulfurtransferase
VQTELSANDLALLLGTEDEPFILDVREPDEASSWSIPGAVNIPLRELATRVAEVPDAGTILTVCAAGVRSRQAAALLEAEGYDVANLQGGMAAWGLVYDESVLEVPGATVVQVRRRGKGCLSYIVGAGHEAFVFDPSSRVELYRQTCARYGWRVTRIFDTHLHADHVSGGRALAAATAASLHLNPADPFAYAFSPLADGDRFPLGADGPVVTVLHTPGHTLGSTCYLVGGTTLVSGDTLLAEGVGRPDLADRAEEYAGNLYRSLQAKVLPLDDTTAVLPGHYGERTIVQPGQPLHRGLGELRAALAPLSYTEGDFVTWAAAQAKRRPPNYEAVVKANVTGTAPTDEVAAEMEAGPNRCAC